MHEVMIDVLMIIVSVISAMVSAYLIPYIKAKTNSEKYADLMDIIVVAVKAAEQTINGSGLGKVKKTEVVSFVSHWLAEKNIQISEAELDKLIEACVLNLKLEMKE